MSKSAKETTGDKVEKEGKEIFKKIGLKCFGPSGQVSINSLQPGHKDSDNIEIDYFIPEKKLCLIGEITSRANEKDIRDKYNRFIRVFNLLKKIDFSDNTWKTLGIPQENISDFREVENIKGFFITTIKEKGDVKLDNIEGMAVFYQSDFKRLSDYSEMIGKWTKNFFLNNFSFYHSTNNAITIYETDICLIRHTYRNISKKEKDTPLTDLYTFAISPYELLDIAHVYRRDELPSLETCPYNYQRTLDNKKLEEIRKTLLINKDFMFPSNILVVLSQECEYIHQKDKSGRNYLLIPRKYGNISVIDGQHRLFSYANDEIKSQMGDDCKIIVTGVKFKTDDHKLISKSSAQIFIEINSNQTKIEISHLDHISYELGNDEPKIIARRILVEINNRQKFNHFFDIKSDKSDKLNKKTVETKTIINEMKKISNLRTIQRLQNPRSDINKKKKTGYESLFNATVLELSNRESLLEKGVILFERYFSLIFKIFKYDKPKDTDKSDILTSFSYANFWGGWVQLLALFIDEGLNWESVEKELEKIKQNVMELLEVTDYQTPLFDPKDKRVPSSHRPGESCKFLHYNREKSVSVQDLRS